MKATLEVPDELYRQVKAKSALEGRTLKQVAEELFRRYVSASEPASRPEAGPSPSGAGSEAGEARPPWFGRFRKLAQGAERHDLEAIRSSIAAGLARERGL